MRKIVGQIKQYHWGKQADKSLIMELLCSSGNIDFLKPIDQCSPIAEYWLGSHKSGPFKFLDENIIPLEVKIRFLLKILCVNDCLSVQIHPDKTNAIKLHQDDPNNYPDDNPKPELVVALSKFRALCGFRSSTEIQENINTCPFLKTLFKKVNGSLEITENNLKEIIHHILTLEKNEVVNAISQCLKYFSDDHECSQLIRELSSSYPEDAGILLVLFLKLHTLDTGESLYVPANVPHAYLAGGDAIEVMVCSDNVIRAALTPKFKDLPNLMKLMAISTVSKLSPIKVPPYFTVYKLPCEEYFEVRTFQCDNSELLPFTVPYVDRQSILLIIKGACRLSNGEIIEAGQSLLIDSYESMQLQEYIKLPFQFFQAY
ncbi:hypothetical protein GJ496_008982 [Pomphorhynchus laevis]|nr:hypothetical protein GJ496_008982 [Pomphorhynchus laevis]